MKTKFFLTAMLIFPITAMGQLKNDTVTEIIVTPPVFTGIKNVVVQNSLQNSIDDYLVSNFQIPATAVECLIKGTGVVRFTVKPTGELAGFEVINSICPEVDTEFIRVLKSTDGIWKPGHNNGEPVEMQKEVSMMFFPDLKLNPKEYFARLAKISGKKGNNLFLKKGNPKKALKYYDQSIKFLPYETSPLLLRGLCRYELGDYEGACSDWKRINEIGNYDADEFIGNLCGLKGYEEMVEILKK